MSSAYAGKELLAEKSCLVEGWQEVAGPEKIITI